MVRPPASFDDQPGSMSWADVGEGSAADRRRRRRDTLLPGWYGTALAAVLAAVLSVAVVGLLLAIAGWFEPLPLVVLVAAAWVALMAWWRPWDTGGRAPPSASWATAAVVAVVGVLTVWNGANASSHLVTDRDPGVYVTTGRWLARDGGLLVEPDQGPFADADVRYEEQGWNLDDDGRLEPQFLHGLPVLLAVGHWVGGDVGLLAVPALLGGLALLTFYALVCRFMRPWWAVLATVALGINLVQLHATRDAYSELLAQVLLFGGLWALWGARPRLEAPPALVGGLLIGSVAAVRVEGFVVLVPMVVWLVVELVLARDRPAEDRRSTHRFLRAAGVGIAVGALLGVADLALRGRWYLDHLRATLLPVAVGVVVAIAVGVAVVMLAPRLRPVGRVLQRRSARLGLIVAVAVVVVAGAGWWIRPMVQEVTGDRIEAVAAIQARSGLEVDGTRRYSEHSMRWLAWYVGSPALVAAIVGLAVAARRLVHHPRRCLPALPALTAFVALSVLYLWQPSIVPDQIWVMRRYLLVTIPGVVALAVWVASLLSDASRRPLRGRWGVVARVTGLALALAVVAYPAAALAPVRTVSSWDGLRGGINDVCDALGDDAAALVATGGDLELILPQSLRAFCGVPAAVAPPEMTAQAVAALAGEWRDEGGVLALVGTPEATAALSTRDPLVTITVTNNRNLEALLVERPDDLTARALVLSVVLVTPR